MEIAMSDPSQLRVPKRFSTVRGVRMARIEIGSGDPIVFLHGNPTSSFLWRNILPYLEGSGRCIAPDLVGMGDSDKLAESGPGRYRIAEQREHLDALLEQLGVREHVILVLHDWGSALGFDWARRHPEAIRGIAYMESIVRPYSRADMGEHGDFLDRLRGPDGERMILDENLFVEQFLPRLVLRNLTKAEMEEYRRPFAEPGESRRPTLTMPREIPIDGQPSDTHEMVAAYSTWIRTSPVPKLFVNARPGAAISGETVDFCRTWPNQTEVQVDGLHFLQEDSPDEIGRAILEWARRL
jgi:haloalkane dehalogenase